MIDSKNGKREREIIESSHAETSATRPPQGTFVLDWLGRKFEQKEIWDTYSQTFNKMVSFELIDMKRFEKKE